MAQGKLNGFDFKTTFGIEISDGLKGFEDPDIPKETESYDWPELNGREYSSAPVVFQDSEVTLSCILIASSLSDGITKKDLLLSELKKTGTQTLFINSTNKTYNVRYKSASKIDWHMNGDVKRVGTFTLTLIKCLQLIQTTTQILDGNG